MVLRRNNPTRGVTDLKMLFYLCGGRIVRPISEDGRFVLLLFELFDGGAPQGPDTLIT